LKRIFFFFRKGSKKTFSVIRDLAAPRHPVALASLLRKTGTRPPESIAKVFLLLFPQKKKNFFNYSPSVEH